MPNLVIPLSDDLGFFGVDLGDLRRYYSALTATSRD